MGAMDSAIRALKVKLITLKIGRVVPELYPFKMDAWSTLSAPPGINYIRVNAFLCVGKELGTFTITIGHVMRAHHNHKHN